MKFVEKNFKVISYNKITPTQYEFLKNELVATVNNSASALILPFSQVRTVRRIKFKWKVKGKLNLTSAKLESSKAGDDSYFRVGLMVSGKAPFVPFFAPTWIKLTKQYLKRPSNGMRVHFINAQHAPGKTWLSPYSNSIRNYSAGSTVTADGYHQVIIAVKGVATVGLWLAADGDDTKSSFKVWIKDFQIQY